MKAIELLRTADSFERLHKPKGGGYWSAIKNGRTIGRVSEAVLRKWRESQMVEINQGAEQDYAYPLPCSGCCEIGVPLDEAGYCEECECECEVCGDRKRIDEMETEHLCADCLSEDKS